MRQIFLDTETTGLSPEQGDRIVEIGCVELVNRQLTGRNLHYYLNPERKNSEEAVRIHGLTDEFLADKPRFAEIVEPLMNFVADAEIIIHNASFDLGFLNAELRRLNQPEFTAQTRGVLDTLLMAREMFPGKSNSLDALCRRFEVDNSNRTLHGALLDAELLAEVYIRMTRGQGSLVMDMGMGSETSSGGGVQSHQSIDLSQLHLKILGPTEDERAAHEAVLHEIDKSSGGKTIWRKVMA